MIKPVSSVRILRADTAVELEDKINKLITIRSTSSLPVRDVHTSVQIYHDPHFIFGDSKRIREVWVAQITI